MDDKLILGGHEFSSRFILGSGKYSLELIKAAVEQAGAEILTLALRRANPACACGPGTWKNKRSRRVKRTKNHSWKGAIP